MSWRSRTFRQVKADAFARHALGRHLTHILMLCDCENHVDKVSGSWCR